VKPLVLDLFSGTGSATQPFVECGKHRVVRIDIAGKPDVRADVRNLPLDPDLRPEFVWASPPCQKYSGLRSNPWKANRELWEETLRAIHRFQPRWWVVENVKMAQWVWGRAPYHYGPFFLWGYYPPLPPAWSAWQHSFKGTHNFTRSGGRRYNEKLTAEERAMIPRPLAEAVHRAVCEEVRGT
jgi:C-5 cytosine-specific DNA methylase